jgi:hypothetical protein
MHRALTCLTLLLLTATVAVAQTPQPGEPIPLTVSPATVPVPATKYRLLPEPRDQTPGNAAAHYYRAEALLCDNDELLQDVRSGPWDIWLALPLAELPRQEVRDRLGRIKPLLHEVERGARCRHCDWQLENRPEGIGLLLPDVQGFRRFALILAVQARLEIAEGRYAEALHTLQTGYALARDMSFGPTLIQTLIGVAIASIMDNQLDQLVQQPGAPNLYWSLTSLPREFFDPQIAIHEEGTVLERMWPGLKQLEEGPMTLAQLVALKESILSTYDQFNAVRPTTLAVALQVLAQTGAYADARQWLLGQGMSAAQVDEMPHLQVVLLWAVRQYRQAWDDYVKWLHVRNFDTEPGYKQARQKLAEGAERLYRLLFYGGGLLRSLEVFAPPAYERVYMAMGRSERRFAALRCVEALRLYAAGHGGRLPATLKEITEVPIPDDPVSGKPFRYEVNGDKAKLSAPLPPGDKPLPQQLLTYELTVRR